MNIALIFAGGSGNRMGTVLPKQFLKINGVPNPSRLSSGMYSGSYQIGDVVKALYPSLSYGGKTFQYAPAGSPQASQSGYYTVQPFRVVVAGGANSGNNLDSTFAESVEGGCEYRRRLVVQSANCSECVNTGHNTALRRRGQQPHGLAHWRKESRTGSVPECASRVGEHEVQCAGGQSLHSRAKSEALKFPICVLYRGGGESEQHCRILDGDWRREPVFEKRKDYELGDRRKSVAV